MWICICGQHLSDLDRACNKCGTVRIDLERRRTKQEVDPHQTNDYEAARQTTPQGGEDSARQVFEVARLYRDYLEVVKRLFGFGSWFRRGKLDLDECEGLALDISSQVRQLRLEIEARATIFNQGFLEFVKSLDVACSSFAVYLGSKRQFAEYGPPVVTRAELLRAESECVHWNRLLGKAARNFNRL